ncbi:uncharacterized protein RCH25_036662 [Pelodytes ibericus]
MEGKRILSKGKSLARSGCEDNSSTRAVRFSFEENSTLISKVCEYYDEIIGSAAPETPQKKKNELWKKIVNAVNAVGGNNRTELVVKKRYFDVKRQLKRKLCKAASHANGIGVDKPEDADLTTYEEELLQVLVPGTVIGIQGRLDTDRPTATIAALKSSQKKSELRQKIVDAVKAVGRNRTERVVKKKYFNVKSKLKKKLCRPSYHARPVKVNQTLHEDVTSDEEELLEALGLEIVLGSNGGLDTDRPVVSQGPTPTIHLTEHEPAASGSAEALRGHTPDQLTGSVKSMGLKNLCRFRTRPHMLNIQQRTTDSSVEDPTSLMEAPGYSKTQPCSLDDAPSTKGDLKKLIGELQKIWKQDLVGVSADISALQSKMTGLEATKADTQKRLTELTAASETTELLTRQVCDLQKQVSLLDAKLRHANVRIRGVPPDYQTDFQLKRHSELPLRRLEIALGLSGKRGPTEFEGVEIQIFDDIAPATMFWRRSMRPLTTHLRNCGVKYRWGLLTVSTEEMILSIESPADIDNFLHNLALLSGDQEEIISIIVGAEDVPSTSTAICHQSSAVSSSSNGHLDASVAVLVDKTTEQLSKMSELMLSQRHSEESHHLEIMDALHGIRSDLAELRNQTQISNEVQNQKRLDNKLFRKQLLQIKKEKLEILRMKYGLAVPSPANPPSEQQPQQSQEEESSNEDDISNPQVKRLRKGKERFILLF